MRLHSRIGTATHHNALAADTLTFRSPQSNLVTTVTQYDLSISGYGYPKSTPKQKMRGTPASSGGRCSAYRHPTGTRNLRLGLRSSGPVIANRSCSTSGAGLGGGSNCKKQYGDPAAAPKRGV